MKVGFVETMRGTLRTNDGRESPVEFEVHAQADHLRQFLKDGQTRLSGILRAPLWAAEVPAVGELTIDLPRSLTYRVSFESGGMSYRLEGQKHPSLFAPVRSMTQMAVALKTGAGEPLAQGEMSFAIRELGGFLASWLPFVAKPRVSLDIRRRQLERQAITGAGR